MLVGQEITFMDSLMVAITGILIVMLELAMLAVIVLLLSKMVRAFEGKGKKTAEVEEVATIPLERSSAHTIEPAAPAVVPGAVQLIDTDEPTAAAIMAIVSDQTGISLDNLQFRSIRHIVADDKTLAVILSLISNESGIPVERLHIKSIKELN